MLNIKNSIGKNSIGVGIALSLALVGGVFFGTLANAHAPMLEITEIDGQSTANPIVIVAESLPHTVTVEIFIDHEQNAHSVKDLALFVDGTQEGELLQPTQALCDGASTCTLSMPWNIAASGLHEIFVNAYHGNKNDPNNTAVSATVEVSVVPPTDVCPNLEGDQETVPEGYVIDDEGNCVEDVPAPTEDTEELCTDGIDNDNDGLIDFDDPDCSAFIPDPTEDTEPLCTDGIDNDGDGLIDFDDPDCEPFIPPVDVCPNLEGDQAEVPEGLVLNEFGRCLPDDTTPIDVCPNIDGDQEEVPEGYVLLRTRCFLDTDGDGVPDETDNCPLVANPDQEDADENGVGDACEEPPTEDTEELCTDGIDNDNDGLIDLDDPDCEPFIPPVDVCPNLEGDQAEVPEGLVLNDEGNCVAEDNNGGGGTSPPPSPPPSGPNSSSGGFAPGAGSSGGTVLGAFTEEGATCDEYLTKYIFDGRANDASEVKKLQAFLNAFEGTDLPITGVYGPLTRDAVDAFQVKYWTPVLLPWVAHGLPTAQTPTGHVFKTTKHQINRMYCPSLALATPQLP